MQSSSSFTNSRGKMGPKLRCRMRVVWSKRAAASSSPLLSRVTMPSPGSPSPGRRPGWSPRDSLLVVAPLLVSSVDSDAALVRSSPPPPPPTDHRHHMNEYDDDTDGRAVDTHTLIHARSSWAECSLFGRLQGRSAAP